MMEVSNKEKVIGVAAVLVAALLVLFLKGKATAGVGGANLTGGMSTDIPGGFTTADTIYVPTSSYNIQYNTVKGDVNYNPAPTNVTPSPVSIPIPPISAPPAITTTSPSVVNIPTVQTNTAPKTTAPLYTGGQLTTAQNRFLGQIQQVAAPNTAQLQTLGTIAAVNIEKVDVNTSQLSAAQKRFYNQASTILLTGGHLSAAQEQTLGSIVNKAGTIKK